MPRRVWGALRKTGPEIVPRTWMNSLDGQEQVPLNLARCPLILDLIGLGAC